MAAITGNLADRFLMPERSDPRQRASRSRLIPAEPLAGSLPGGPLANAPLLGRIEVYNHGGKSNPVINRGQSHSRTKSISKKTGMTHFGEGTGEQWLEMTNEIAGNVIDFIAHPGKFHIDMGTSAFSYRPDFLVQYLDGTIKVIEVKRSLADIDVELAEKFAGMHEFSRRIGWEFGVMFTPDIMGSRTKQHNIMNIYGRRGKDLSDQALDIARSLRKSGKAISFQDLTAKVSPNDPLAGKVIVQTMIAHGHLLADLGAQIGEAAILTPTPQHDGRSQIRLMEKIK